jgi:hypothetical protein
MKYEISFCGLVLGERREVGILANWISPREMGKKQLSLFFKYFELLLSMAEMGETIRIVKSDEVVGDRNKSCGGRRRTESFHSTFRDQSLG